MSAMVPPDAHVRNVSPDPSITTAIGCHHTLETAIADLVDNCLDANATRVLVRFLEQDGMLVGLRLVDNGDGMDAARIDDAMVYARKRDYRAGELGHFGLGLKSASLSQANILRVYSKMAGCLPAGREITVAAPTKVAVLDDSHVGAFLGAFHHDLIQSSGTVIEWDEPRTFLRSFDAAENSRWIDERIATVMTHLGIVFHRKIAKHQVAISIDVFNLDLKHPGPTRTVTSVDPFNYVQLLNDPYPADFSAKIGEFEVQGTAHIWPAAQSDGAEFRLRGRRGAQTQGFYFYRNDRLLQIGGWNTVTTERPELEYARVSIDITNQLEPHVAMNPEKSGLKLTADFRSSLMAAAIGGTVSFNDYLSKASSVRSDTRRYAKRSVTLVDLGCGFSPVMKNAFSSAVSLHDSGPVDILWRAELSEAPFEIDLDSRTVWLNEQYREVIAGADSSDCVDGPLVKTLLVLLFSKYFEGARLGSREKSEVLTWQRLLTAALQDEIAQREQRLRNDEKA